MPGDKSERRLQALSAAEASSSAAVTAAGNGNGNGKNTSATKRKNAPKVDEDEDEDDSGDESGSDVVCVGFLVDYLSNIDLHPQDWIEP